MKKLFPGLMLAGLLLLSLGSCKTKANNAETDERDSTYTQVKHPEWSRNAVIYEVNLRQYTPEGTVTAFQQYLPQLKELGVDILWFMPINPISEKDRKGELGSYYAVADYEAFNPEFGTVEQFKAMVEQAHSMGFKVLIDWVANHSGRDNKWVTEHPDFYEKDSLGNMKGLYDWTDVYVLDYTNPELRKAMIAAMKYWITEVGVDGFRCDVAMEVPTDFWNEARTELQQAQPELFMLAEATAPDLQVLAFDMGYNWPMKDLFNEIAATSGQYTFKGENGEVRSFPETHAIAINNLIEQQYLDFPKDTYLMNMITNHDLNSWEGTEFQRYGVLTDAFAVLSYTLPGMPLIYTGQETGMNRAFEFFKKDTPPQWEPRNEYFTFYQKLNELKHSQKALAAGLDGGDIISYATSSPDLYIFSREKDNSRVVTLVNLGNGELPVEFTTDNTPEVGEMINFFTGEEAVIPSTLKQGEYLIFINKK
ncbi:MAG: alpha-amylase [Muribaculaceae bacterium]|nr:alpha-amylase [Muribaculaceae bacterium]